MTMALDTVKSKMAQTASRGTKGQEPATTVQQYLERMKPQIALALPKHMTPERMARVALTTIRTNPKLLGCSMASIMAAVMQAAQLGLEPGLLGHCYIIPYGSEATFIIGYKGMIDLARRSGNIKSIDVREVFANDEFSVKYNIGGVDEITHVPWFCKDGITAPGALRGCYSVAHFNDGGSHFHYMPTSQIEEHRGRSKAKSSGPWVTDYIEMCKKTVVRSAWKWWPLSIEIARSVMADETVKTSLSADMVDMADEAIDGEFKVIEDTPSSTPHDALTGEVAETS